VLRFEQDNFGIASIVMAALWNRAGHYIFAMWLLIFFFLA